MVKRLIGLLEMQVAFLRERAEVIRSMAGCIAGGDYDLLEEKLKREIEVDDIDLAPYIAEECRFILTGMGVDATRATVGKVVERLEGTPEGTALAEARERLQLAVEQVRVETERLAVAARQALEINMELLEAVFGGRMDVGTYSREGTVERTVECSSAVDRSA